MKFWNFRTKSSTEGESICMLVAHLHVLKYTLIPSLNYA